MTGSIDGRPPVRRLPAGADAVPGGRHFSARAPGRGAIEVVERGAPRG